MDLRQRYVNQTKCKKHIQEILKNQIVGEIFLNSDLVELLKSHPTRTINNIEHFVMKNKHYGSPTLHYKNNNNYYSVSWIVCIKNLYGKYDVVKQQKIDVKSSYRYLISPHTFEFLKNNTYKKNNIWVGICHNCGIEKKMEVDHCITPFSKLYEKFNTQYNINENNLEVYKEGLFFTLKDKEISEKWINFHNTNATYRTLCKTCNCSIGTK